MISGSENWIGSIGESPITISRLLEHFNRMLTGACPSSGAFFAEL